MCDVPLLRSTCPLVATDRGTHAANWRKDWKALLFIGAVNGPQIALNNASLVSIELSLNQVIRAGIPVCVAAFAFCLELGAFVLQGSQFATQGVRPLL